MKVKLVEQIVSSALEVWTKVSADPSAYRRRLEKGAALEVPAPPTPVTLGTRTNHREGAPERAIKVTCWKQYSILLVHKHY